MTITSSETVSVAAQRDGRRYVLERHIDHLGAIHERTWLAGAADNLAAALSANAVTLLEILKQREMLASGITVELGSMRVTEQIDALRAIGVNYIKRLVVPRMLAAVIVFPLVTAMADGMGLFGGMLVVVFERDVDAYLYWNTIAYWVVLKDFLSGLAKSVVFGVLVALIGCHNGLATSGGTEGLGRSTTATVVQVAMAVIISDFFLTRLLLFLFW